MKPTRVLQLVATLVIGGVCLWLALRGVPLDELPKALGKLPWQYHLALLGAIVVMFVLRSLRWAIQAQGLIGRMPSLREACAINSVAFMAIFLFPFRLGEFVRPVLCAQRKLMSVSAGFANSFVERIVDGLVTGGFFAIVMLGLSDRGLPQAVHTGGYLTLAFFGSVAAALVVAFIWRQASVRFWRRILSAIHPVLAEKLVGMLEAFLDGLSSFRTVAAVLTYLVLTVVYWLINGATMWMVLTGMGIHVDLIVGYFVISFLVVGVMIPAPPGNVGTFHAFATMALTLLGVAKAEAFAFAVLLHAWQVAGVLLCAGVFVALGDVSLARVKEATQVATEEAK